MRTPILAGNWKMFKTVAESIAFVRELAPRLQPFSSVERVVCPTFVALSGVAEALAGTGIGVGAQNMHWKDSGAYTSQISPVMLAGLAEYVILGHSECRQYLGETDADINLKVKAALAHGLKPIFAVGENLEQRDQGITHDFVSQQVRAGLDGISADDVRRVIIAYEPIWAIGTGRAATGEDANLVCRDTVRGTLRTMYGDDTANAVRIQYGGSVKPENIGEYMSYPDIDGALVGGASLKVEDFTALVEAAARAKGTHA
ncbi:triose-phosphate isomerase [Anaerolineae bacterium CFX9]|nr:triose-phosphate isomerase [Kamptonema cortianum]MDL1902779.1 triose-phosphate isomerase [Anaerolineae bacterium CFX9]